MPELREVLTIGNTVSLETTTGLEYNHVVVEDISDDAVEIKYDSGDLELVPLSDITKAERH